MVQGVFLIKWDQVQGGEVYMKHPEDLNIPDNVVQQIQISHDFVQEKITIQELDWNSISYFNPNKEMVIVLVLDKFDDAADYTLLLEEFSKEIESTKSDEELKKKLENFYTFSLPNVFRTRDEVIAKLSNEVASLKMKEYDMQRKLEKLTQIDDLSVKNKILILLTVNDTLSIKDLVKQVKTSKRWVESVVQTLLKNNILGFDNNRDVYYLNS